MAPFMRPRLFSAASVTVCGVSPRLTQFLMISSAWIGCSSSYLACSSSHHRPRGPIFSFLARPRSAFSEIRSEEHTSELQSRGHLVCRLLLEKKNEAAILRRAPHLEAMAIM